MKETFTFLALAFALAFAITLADVALAHRMREIPMLLACEVLLGISLAGRAIASDRERRAEARERERESSR